MVILVVESKEQNALKLIHGYLSGRKQRTKCFKTHPWLS